jgi:ABC-type dipeptide/oligopeptide/nickel transport system permease component
MFRYTGDPVLMLAGKYATQQEREMVRDPTAWTAPCTQYVSFIGGALKGNFGKSYISSVDALDMILERMPATLELALWPSAFRSPWGWDWGWWSRCGPAGH